MKSNNDSHTCSIPLVNLDYWCSMDIKAIVEEDFFIPRIDLCQLLI